MKKIILLKIIIFSFILLTSCNDKVNKKKFDISMQKINGEWIRESYLLPDDSYFYINTYKGSYWLSYNRKNQNWLAKNPMGFTIKNAIIDYRINN